MYPLVLGEARGLAKGFATELAAVGAFAGMHVEVLQQRRALPEGLGAVRAGVGTLACVNA
jgi:hypothetical protein